MSNLQKSAIAIRNSGLDPDSALAGFFRNQNQDWTVKTGIGGIFNALALALFCVNPLLFPVSVCLLAMVQGYALRTLRAYIKDENGPMPPWDDWFDLFVSGMSWIAIMVLFGFLLMTFSMFCMIGGILAQSSKSMDPNFVLWAGGTMVGIKLIGAWLAFFLAVLMANFAEEESMPAGFAYFKVMKRMLLAPGDFLCAWMIGVGLQLMFFVVPCITIIGIFLLPTSMFTAQILSSIIMAQAWRSASPVDSGKKSDEETGNETGNETSSEIDEEPKSETKKAEPADQEESSD